MSPELGGGLLNGEARAASRAQSAQGPVHLSSRLPRRGLIGERHGSLNALGRAVGRFGELERGAADTAAPRS